MVREATTYLPVLIARGNPQWMPIIMASEKVPYLPIIMARICASMAAYYNG
jgi:hypothetical protein